MTKVLTFARHFPAFHPKAGGPTYFVEKFWKAIQIRNWQDELKELNPKFGPFDIDDSGEILNGLGNKIIDYKGDPKYTTIRAGNNWKVGDKFIPRVWSGKPYNSPQITIAPDIEVVKVWDFEIKIISHPQLIAPQAAAYINGAPVIGDTYFKLAKNDGLSHIDFIDWFQPRRRPTEFSGQIITWNKDIKY